mgnify:CR=1 FL=1
MKRIGWWIALVTGTLALAGCFNPFSPLVSTQRATSAPAPVPNSPANVIRLFEWCWNNRGINEYEEIFTDDYRFQFALGDSAGNAYRDVPFTREDELRTARGLFVGSTDRDAASDISLSLDKTLFGLPDDRPGKDPRWHKSIRSKVNLAVTLNEGGATVLNDVSGFAKFYLVRGDSAIIPPELKDKGFKPDSSRWWIDRWEDETLPAGGLRANPANNRSWGALKTLFR